MELGLRQGARRLRPVLEQPYPYVYRWMLCMANFCTCWLIQHAVAQRGLLSVQLGLSALLAAAWECCKSGACQSL